MVIDQLPALRQSIVTGLLFDLIGLHQGVHVRLFRSLLGVG